VTGDFTGGIRWIFLRVADNTPEAGTGTSNDSAFLVNRPWADFTSTPAKLLEPVSRDQRQLRDGGTVPTQL